MVLASIDYELWRGQAQNGVNLAFQVKFDLEGQGQSPPKTIGTLTKLFCTFCPNLVVLAWTRRDLWRGQARGWRTHTQTDTHTDRQTQATTIPEGQNWPRVKMEHRALRFAEDNLRLIYCFFYHYFFHFYYVVFCICLGIINTFGTYSNYMFALLIHFGMGFWIVIFNFHVYVFIEWNAISFSQCLWISIYTIYFIYLYLRVTLVIILTYSIYILYVYIIYRNANLYYHNWAPVLMLFLWGDAQSAYCVLNHWKTRYKWGSSCTAINLCHLPGGLVLDSFTHISQTCFTGTMMTSPNGNIFRVSG